MLEFEENSIDPELKRYCQQRPQILKKRIAELKRIVKHADIPLSLETAIMPIIMELDEDATHFTEIGQKATVSKNTYYVNRCLRGAIAGDHHISEALVRNLKLHHNDLVVITKNNHDRPYLQVLKHEHNVAEIDNPQIIRYQNAKITVIDNRLCAEINNNGNHRYIDIDDYAIKKMHLNEGDSVDLARYCNQDINETQVVWKNQPPERN